MSRQLVDNVVQGSRCALFLPLQRHRLGVGPEQLLWLVLLQAALVFAGGLLLALPDPEFYPYGVPVEALAIGLTLLSAALIARLPGLGGQLPELAVWLFATDIAITVASYAIALLYPYLPDLLTLPLSDSMDVLGLLFMLWTLAVVLRILRLLTGGFDRRSLAALALFLLIQQLPMFYYGDYGEMWYAAEGEQADDEWAAYRALDAEELLYAQRPRMETALSGLAAGEPGHPDLYFLGFAGYARENVFRNEVGLAQRIFEQRFGTADRSLSLVNHLDNLHSAPLATSVNLRLALQRIGQLMNPEEDILVLFMTSHGSPQHRLDVDFWPLPLNDISPEMLKDYLDQAGIKWRVVMVSSCYSGGFVQPLRDEHTLIATAAAPDRTSFGCGKSRDLTYFGEAFLRDQLQHDGSIVAALQSAMSAIGERERRERLEPSHPQLFVGEAIAQKLDRVEPVPRPAQCGGRTAEC